MITIQERIYSRLIGDATLVSLVGSSDRIHASLDQALIKSPCVVFDNLVNAPGLLDSDDVSTDVETWAFRVFANNCKAIIARLRALLDRYTFAETTEAGCLRCVWDGDGPDIFDEDLQVRRKDVRFRIYSMPKGIGPA